MKSADLLALIVGTANLEEELAPKIADLERRKKLIIAEVEKARGVEATDTGGRTYKWAGDGPLAGLSMVVSWPASTVKWPSSKEKEKQDVLKRICGELFPKLFFTIPLTLAVKDFRSVAVAVLGKAKAKKVIALCEVENGPKLKFTRKDPE